MTETEDRESRPRSRERPAATIRPLAPGDREAVRDICCRTAFRNIGSDRFFEDREVHADFWTRYYTDFNAAEAWVIVEGDAVIGYFFGCSDHARFQRVMATRILPVCLARTLWRLAAGRYAKPETRRYIRHMIFRGSREAPQIDYRRFPAHYHCNMLRQAYGQGFYTRLTLMFLDLLDSKGISTLHGHITEPVESGMWQRFADRYSTASADVTCEVPTTLFREVVGDERPMVNRAWGISVQNYRGWIAWLRDTYRL